jgi:membrane protein implicated in regulation of membrane protease activity
MLMDTISWQWIWLALGIALLITEVATTALVVLPLAIGAFAAAVVAFFGGPVDLQFVTAAVVSVVSFAAIRPLATRVNKAGQVEGIGAHRLTNARGVALSDIDRSGTGMVQIEGEQWHGATVDDIVIAEGSDVRILRVEGSKVMVAPHSEPTTEPTPGSGDESSQESGNESSQDSPKGVDSGANTSINEEPPEEQQ